MTRFKQFFIAIICFFFVASAYASITLQEMSGRMIPFSELAGKWVLINYWAGWCKSCIAEIPELNHFYEINKDKNVVIFAVNYDAYPLGMQQKLIKQLDIRYPSLKQDPASDLQLGDIRGVPVTFVINPQGELSDVLYGGQSAASLQKAIT